MEGEICYSENLERFHNLTPQELWEHVLDEENSEVVKKLPTYILLAILMLVGLPGNALVILVYGFRFPPSTTKSFIMAMASFDLLNCLLGMPFEMVDLRKDIDLDIPAACKVMRFLVSLSSCGSVTVLVVVAVDRFRRICQPFRKQMSVRQSKILVGLMVLFSFVFCSPALVLYGKQTDYRLNHTVHECSIDDEYRGSILAAGYQYLLGGTWVVCIIVLIVMYGFIIVNIHNQKKRRRTLSAQSYGSMPVLPQITICLTNTNHNHKPDPVTTEVISCSRDKVLTCSRNGNSTIYSINDADLQEEDSHHNSTSLLVKDGVKLSRCSEFNNSVKRLFSRDVNPVFDDEKVETPVDDKIVYDDDDIISILECPVRSTSVVTKTSLNNYLSGSVDTFPASRKVSKVSYDLVDNQEYVPERFRKMGHTFGRFRPWDSEEAMQPREEVRGREWASHSTPGIDECGYSSTVRRASSMPVLIDYVTNTSREQAQSRDDCNYDDCSQEADRSSIRSRNSLKHSASDDSLCSMPGRPRDLLKPTKLRAANVTWDSMEVNPSTTSNNSALLTSAKLSSCSTTSINKLGVSSSRSASVATTSNKRRKSCIRQIRTSRVTIMMLLVTLGFVLSYLPHLIVQIFSNLAPTFVMKMLCVRGSYYIAHHFFKRSFFINNALNPVIYSFYNKTFRSRCIRFIKSPKHLLSGATHSVENGLSQSQDNDTS
ncbi:uncharacterized protein LOC131951635 [Physella acuta]|uniref:uncharacterized protein LOC131951635 n=1 Tax=Physella acuta TaxID=109671 RepID=UPI0027DB7785|nr:uncharacterized protein LOC131951635 [Physella acuta]